MSKRFRELAEKAGYYIDPDFDIEFEVFAELIVGECVSIVSKRKDQAIDNDMNVDEAMSMACFDLEEHFGVDSA